MAYFQFLAIFLGIPLLGISGLTWLDLRKGNWLPGPLQAVPYWIVLTAHVVAAVGYTTPWDNYLVATGVWNYAPQLVAGLTLGWVPIEEYIFFALQTLWAGLLLRWLAARQSYNSSLPKSGGGYRWLPSICLGVTWLWAAFGLTSGWKPGTYLDLILVWAIPLLMAQFAFGGDILWRYRRPVLLALAITVGYLSVCDSLAIHSGTWTIDPRQSSNIFLGGILPLEEFIFFLLTNGLILLGMTLVLAKDSHERFAQFRERLRSRTLQEIDGKQIKDHGVFLKIDHLSKSYQEGETSHPILKDVEVEIAQGESIAILGKSGSGKSTLLNLISGIDQVDGGEIWLQGSNLTSMKELQRTLFRRQSVGFIFQFLT